MDQIPDPYQNEPQFRPRSPMAKPAAIPDARLDYFMQEDAPSLVARQGSTTTSHSSSSTSVCGPKDTTGPCERPHSGSDSTMVIVVGTVIPIVIAIIIMIFLHRRHVKKLRKEDAEDKHGSLDFGMGEGRRPQPTKSRRWKKQPPPPPPPEMTMADARVALRGERGLSIDLGTNPYLLPAGLANSRESLHSMSRTANLGDDKYQRTNFVPDDGSIRSPSVRGFRGDDSSSFSSSARFRNDAESSRSLIHGGGGAPPRPAPPVNAFLPDYIERRASPAPATLLAPTIPDQRQSTISTNSNTAAFRASNNYLGAFIRGGGGGGNVAPDEKKADKQKAADVKITEKEVLLTPEEETKPPPGPLPAIMMNDEPLQHGLNSDYSDYSDHQTPLYSTHAPPQRPSLTTSVPPEHEPSLPQLSVMDFDSQESTPKESRETSQYGATQPASVDQSRASSGYVATQPTSPDQSRTTSTYHQLNQSQPPSDQHVTPEFQAQPREYQQYQQYDNDDDYYDPEDTYSVYDDYGEDYPDQRRLTWGMRPLPPDDPSENPEQRANRIRSFYKEYFDESGKPGSNVAQYYDGSEEYYDYYEQEYYPPRGMSAAGGRNRAMSNGSYMSYGYAPRAFSSASGQYGRPPPRHRMPPKKKMAPLKALNVLPTPSALKDDSFLIDMAVDFAPPDRAKLQRSGTPDSRRGGQRPYSPSVRAFTPLQSSYDDLAVLPSPHLLRKSGTFTALDFAPPGRIGGPDSMSESGSIRSARSGISRMHEDSIRKGAYRVSRIPREVAGTRNEIHDALRPKWEMR